MNACIFDLDGTLANTLESLSFSVKETLREMGLPEITTDECRSFVGNGAKRLVESALRATGDENITRLDEGLEVYRRIFNAHCTYHVTPYDGINQMLRQLKDRAIKLAVLSNKPHEQTVKVVEEMFGKDIFSDILEQKEGIARKPNPDGVYILLDKMGVKKEDCLYVGDSEVDIQTGRNAGVQTLCVSWGFRGKKKLEEAGADIIIDSPDELVRFA